MDFSFIGQLRDTTRRVLREKEQKKESSGPTEAELNEIAEKEAEKVVTKIKEEAPRLAAMGESKMRVFVFDTKDCITAQMEKTGWNPKPECLKHNPKKVYEHCVAMGFRTTIEDCTYEEKRRDETTKRDYTASIPGFAIWIHWVPS